jgi:hypothetical protein
MSLLPNNSPRLSTKFPPTSWTNKSSINASKT